MNTDRPTVIAVRPGTAMDARPRLFEALAAAFPVVFRPAADGVAGADALLAIAEDGVLAGPEELAREGVPALAVRGDVPGARPTAIELQGDAAVDPRMRGIAVSDRFAPLGPAGRSADVLAEAGGEVAWTRSRGTVPVHRVGSALPELGPDEVLYAIVTKRALTFVALVHFLRELTHDAGWRPPPLRAAIVFDDPNLRWRSYGFIHYRRLVEHADEHNYHASMAMIPLDAGRPHGPTAALFRRRPDRLSVVFHGNDHVKRELLGAADPGAALATAAQALTRVERFERRASLAVDRIMMPPHGLCSEPMTQALGALGFDALCAIHPLPWTEEPPSGPLLAGWHPGGFVGGCAVIPRIPLGSAPVDIALRAFLDQPIVLYGHHDDVAGGLEPLASAAAAVNRLGAVKWTSVGDMAHTNVAMRVVGDRAVVRPFARTVRVALPAAVRTIRVDEPQDALDGAHLAGWSNGGSVQPFGVDVALVDGGSLDLRLHGSDDVDAAAVAAPAWRPWPRLRRAATEARDRALPLRPARAH